MDIARTLGVSHATVVKTLARLNRDKLWHWWAWWRGVMFVSSRTGRIAAKLDAIWQTRYGYTAGGSAAPLMQMPLARAMEDGFVKEPAVVTRKDFNPAGMSAEKIEQMKLEDGVALHEAVKVELSTYARQSGQPIVKPFVLVIARDTTHAKFGNVPFGPEALRSPVDYLNALQGVEIAVQGPRPMTGRVVHADRVT